MSKQLSFHLTLPASVQSWQVTVVISCYTSACAFTMQVAEFRSCTALMAVCSEAVHESISENYHRRPVDNSLHVPNHWRAVAQLILGRIAAASALATLDIFAALRSETRCSPTTAARRNEKLFESQ